MKKFIITICALAIIVVGACFIFGGAVVANATMPSGVVGDTIVVQYAEHSWQYSRSYSHLTAVEQMRRGVGAGQDVQYDIAQRLICSGYSRLEAYNYVLPQLDELLHSATTVQCNRVDAYAVFDSDSNSKFSYCSGRDGISIDIDRLVYLLLGAGHGDSVTLPITVDSALTVEDIMRCTVVRGTYTTSYSNRVNRVANIKRACQLISGSVVGAGQSWSFNDVVGERSIANGFRPSTVIVEGVYGDGIGGGVCQVSTTLYNALLLADITVTKVCQHSLVPSYIEPSFDAMVSYPYADLAFVNSSDMPRYIDCIATNSSVTCTVYGVDSGVNVTRHSQEIERLPFGTNYVVDSYNYPQLIYTTDTMQIVSGSDGVESIGYVQRYRGDILISSSNGRKCKYHKVDRVVARGAIPITDSDLDNMEGYYAIE